MPFDPSSAKPVASDAPQGFDPNTAKPIDSVSTMEDGGLGSDVEAGGETKMNAVPAFGIEVGRGLQHGTGQLISDVGYLGNAGGLAKNPVGSSIQQFGNELMEKANAIPDTGLNGFAKGTANLIGEAAPMLATFAGGEALGFAKLGEGGVKLLSAASKSEKTAKYLSHAIRPMGQATLFGLVNAIDTASTLPETMEFNERVNNIYNSGKYGFIAGAVFTPVMDKFLDVVATHGEKVGKAFMVGMTGSPKAAEEAMDLARKQGSYDRVIVDPSKPYDQRISFQSAMAKDLSPIQRESIHKQILEQQDAEIKAIRDQHQQAQYDLQDKLSQSNHQFKLAETEVSSQINDVYKLQQQAKESAIEGKIAEVGQKNIGKIDGLEVVNAQKLNETATAFDQHVQNTIDLMDASKNMLYDSVAKTDPAGGFKTTEMIGRVKKWLKESYNVDLVKETPMMNMGVSAEYLAQHPEVAAQLQGAASWKMVPHNTAGMLPPDLKRAQSFLIGKGDGYLTRLEALNETNGGKLSLRMLRDDSKLMKQMSYNAETGVADSGMAQLEATIRPNRLIGDVARNNDKGAWIGSPTSLASLKEAAVHDSAISTLLDSSKAIRSEFIGNKEFTANMSSKVKSLLQNREGYASLRAFEDSVGLASDSNLRLTNAFNEFQKTGETIARTRQRLKNALSSAIDNQKSKVMREIGELKRGEITDVMNKRFANKEAMLEMKREAVKARAQDLEKAQDFKHKLSEKINLENKAREQATNEIATLGSYSTGIGKIQRGMMLGTVYGSMSGSPHALVSGAVALALTPRTAIGGARSIKSFMQSGAGRATSEGLQKLAKNKVSQRLLIGSILKQQREASTS